MHFLAVFRLISMVVLVVGASLGLCVFVAWSQGDAPAVQWGVAQAAAVALLAGLAGWLLTRGAGELGRRDGFGVVAFGWVAASLFGALPFLFTGVIPSVAGALFETMSGFTTTGASVIPMVEGIPKSILFWRALTHFFGGMGVLVLVVAILPLLGTGGMQLFRAEMPGPSKDRLTPRIANTAKLLWGVYVGLCALETLLLKFGGMTWFDALCHAMATVATGGFSTRTASIGDYHSPFIEIVVTVFMFLSGANFALHYRALRGEVGAFWRDSEFKLYALIVVFSGLFVTWQLLAAGLHSDLGTSVRSAFFAVTSIITTTGFATDDFDQWPGAVKMILVVLMFVGGCAGSTGGGMKVIRILVVLKAVLREIKLSLRPQSVLQIKVNHRPLEGAIVANIVGFVLIYLLTFGAASLVMTFFTPDLVSAATSVAATLGNVGPGLGAVGPMMNYEAVPPAGKLVLTFCMLLGRLELYTVLVVLLPAFWRK